MWTYRNAHTVDSEVTETQDAGSVRDDADLRIGVGPIPEHGADRFPLLYRDVQGLGAGVEGRVLEADVTNGGGVDEGHHLPGVVDEEAEEKVDIVRLDVGEVQIFVDICLPGPDDLQGTLRLLIRTFHYMGEEPSQVLVHALLRREGETFVAVRHVSGCW